MKPVNVNINVDIDDDAKKIANTYNDIQRERLEYQRKVTEEDDEKLCFRICTSSGTRINVPPRLLRDAIIAGGIIAFSKIIIDIISIIEYKRQ